VSKDSRDDAFARDILQGVPAIAEYLGQPEKLIYYRLQQGHIPATKLGSTWATTKSRLQRLYNGEDSASQK
jgi:hypothetical protein